MTTTDPQSTAPVTDPQAMRSALGGFATGVTVITTVTPTGPIGMTVNSFSSVSLSPPLVQYCIGRRSQLHPLFTAASSFAVNILADDQTELADRFARPGRDRFAATHWRPGTTRVPVFPGASVILECFLQDVIPAGDHDIVLGRVVTLHPRGEKQPLLFYRGDYHSL